MYVKNIGSGVAICRWSAKKWHVAFVLEPNSSNSRTKDILNMFVEQFDCTPIYTIMQYLHTRSLTPVMMLICQLIKT